MNGRRSWVVAILIVGLLGLFFLFSRLRPEVAVMGRSPTPSPKGAAVESAGKESKPPDSPVAAAPSATSKLLIGWREIPSKAAFYGVPISRVVVPGRLLAPRSWGAFITQIQSDQTFGADPQKTDTALRGIGFVQSIDYLLLKESGFKFDRVIAEPKLYFPLGIDNLAASKDPVPVIADRLLSLWEKRSSLAGSVPEQFRSSDVEEAITSRYLMLAASYAGDPRVNDLISRQFQSEERPRVKLAAAVALLQAGNQDVVLNWMTGITDPALQKDALAALGGTTLDGGFVVNEQGLRTKYTAPVALAGRSLDDWILQLARTSSDQDTSELAVRALSGRVDRPDIREFLVSSLSDSSPPWLAAAVFAEGPPLEGTPFYSERVLHWLESKEDRAALWAFNTLQNLPLAAPVATIGPLALREDKRFAQVGLFALYPQCAQDPRATLEILSALEKRWPGDSMVETMGLAIRERLRHVQQDPKFLERDLENALKQGWQPAPR